MAEKLRLDQALVERGLVESRQKAQALILSGVVRLNGQVADKAGKPVKEDDLVELLQGSQDVARSAEKLRHAFEAFGLKADGKNALDIGSSTGGFTQVLLEKGAAHVLAVDVGQGLMHERFAKDPRVTLLEKTNARTLAPSEMLSAREICAIDVSFISLRLILPRMVEVSPSLEWIMALVKPQFEVGRDHVGKGGIVKDEVAVVAMLESLKSFANELGLETRGLIPSRLKGTKGNQEWLWWLGRKGVELG